jgi:cell division protein FtsN
MKKYIVLCAGLCLAMALTGCKSKESAYKKAYEKAKAAETGQNQVIDEAPATAEIPVVTPVQTRPTTQPRVTDNADNVSVREERVAVVNGEGLRNFSVVVGSFSVITNAEGLQQKLKNAGYAAQIVKNVERNMYRVVASTFNDKLSAVESRDQLRNTYPDAWLLYNAK